jgi:hypothetical protein
MTLCAILLNETISYYGQNRSPVCCTFLDASKPFDINNCCKLFKLLLKRELSASIYHLEYLLMSIRIILSMLLGAESCQIYFSAVNSVKQGAVSSPLPILCIDDLLLYCYLLRWALVFMLVHTLLKRSRGRHRS